MPRHVWDSPYKNQPKEDLLQLNVRGSRTDVDTLLSIIPDHGFMSWAVQTYIHNLADHARTHSLTFIDRERLLDIIRKSTDPRFIESTPPRDVAGQTPGVREHTPNRPNILADLDETPKSGRSKGVKRKTG